MSRMASISSTGMGMGHYSRRYPEHTMISVQSDVIALIQQFVECESPSDNRAGVNRFVDLLIESVKNIARVKTYPGGKDFGKHVICEFLLPGSRKIGQVMAQGPSDTVRPSGTMRRMPSRRSRR